MIGAAFVSWWMVPGHAKVLEIPTVEIHSGVHMPMMFQGTPGGGWTEDTIRSAISIGVSGFDSAYDDPSYQTKPLREVLKTVKREDLFITSKIPGPWMVDPEGTEKELDDALTDLGIDYVDLMLSHSPGAWQNMTIEATLQRHWAGFEAFYKAGKARAIGVSNYCPRAIRSILKTAVVAPHVNQVMYHAGMGTDPDGLMSFCLAHNITVQAESSSDWNNHAFYDEPYTSIGAKYNKSGLQVGLRWLVQRGYPAIMGTANPKHQLEDADLFDFELSESEVRKISAQQHCKSGRQKFPFCQVPYFQYKEHRICNIDGKGGQAANWECDDDVALASAMAQIGEDFLSCSEVQDKCDDFEIGAPIRQHCKTTCDQPCQDTVLPPSPSFV